jgi:hypothetical protein
MHRDLDHAIAWLACVVQVARDLIRISVRELDREENLVDLNVTPSAAIIIIVSIVVMAAIVVTIVVMTLLPLGTRREG